MTCTDREFQVNLAKYTIYAQLCFTGVIAFFAAVIAIVGTFYSKILSAPILFFGSCGSCIMYCRYNTAFFGVY